MLLMRDCALMEVWYATGVPYAIAFEYQPLATFNESGITAPALLTDAVNCIRELNLQGIAVKINDLAIFSLGIKNIF